MLIRGHIPDLTPHMDGARIAVAPLRFGAGVKGKINLSMAHGQPVVATQCAVEGMHLRHGDDVLIADDPTEFANAVIRLYRDPALWQRLSNHGLDNIERHFSLAAARPVVKDVLLRQGDCGGSCCPPPWAAALTPLSALRLWAIAQR